MPLGLGSINVGFHDANTQLITSHSKYGSFEYEEEDKDPADIDLDKFKELTKRIKLNTAANFSLSGSTLCFDIRNKGGQDYEKTLVMTKGETCTIQVTTPCALSQKVAGTLGEMNKFIEAILDGKHDRWEMPNF